MLAGVLGRVETAKGVLELVSAARQAAGLPIQWIVAGSGPLENHVRSLDLPNVKCLGYVADSERYLDALDLYVQASHSEGLSLALLEAMRARLPIVATRVGATETAVRDMREALLVQPGDANDILDAVRRLMNDRGLAAGLASAARARFEQAFTIERQHHDFLDIYRSCDRMQS
jgi:glycosyltransferase involved in cell wall biosynthesis